MTLAEYRIEYGRLFAWRELWARLSNKHCWRLASTQEAIERKAARANAAIGRLMRQYDADLEREINKEAIWERRENVSCVECPNCLFTFAAIHTVTDTGTGVYLCPECGFPEGKSSAAVDGMKQ